MVRRGEEVNPEIPAETSDESPGAGPYGEAAVPAGGGLPDGLLVSWGENVNLEDLLDAARRQLRQQAGQDVQAWVSPTPSGRRTVTPAPGMTALPVIFRTPVMFRTPMISSRPPFMRRKHGGGLRRGPQRG